MKKQALALLVTLLFLSITSSNLFAIGGNMGGEAQVGSAEHPYLIQDFADFNEFASDPNYWDDCTRLETDINLAAITYTTAVIAPDTNNIKTYFEGTAFTGVFDGNDHVISNLTIDTNGISNYYLGLFGEISGSAASITNLGIEDVNIIGGDSSRYSGGLCGNNDYGTISNCYCIGSISVGEYSYLTGGLCGRNYGMISNCYSSGSVSSENRSRYTGGLCGGNYYGTITNCHSTSEVNGYDRLGGLCGTNGTSFLGGIINNSYATGDVTGNYAIGGLCGQNDTGTINNSYATGNISGNSSLGGFCGRNYTIISGTSTISDCYATGDVIGLNTPSDLGGFCGTNDHGDINNSYCTGDVSSQGGRPSFLGGFCGINENNGTINSCFWDTETAGNYWPDANSYGALGKTTLEMQTQTTFTDAGWEFDTYLNDKQGWYMPENDYPKCSWQNENLVKVPDVNGMTVSQAQAALTACGFTIGDVHYVKSWQIPTDTVAGISASIGSYFDIALESLDIYISTGSTGDGSETNPYQIASQADLDAVNNAPDASYIMTRNIYMSYNKTYTAAVISTYTNTFTGIFDGNNYTISNLTINSSETDSDYIGLFGRINASDAEVKNLGIKNYNIVTGDNASYIGGLCGFNYYAKIEKCYTTGKIISEKDSSDSVGGLCGESRNCQINDCHTECEIISAGWSKNVGGLCGKSLNAAISNSHSVFNIKISKKNLSSGDNNDHIGGLTGDSSGIIVNCYSTGGIIITSGNNNYNIGGLTGNNRGTLENCYSTGDVISSSDYCHSIAGLVGKNGGTIINCYSKSSVTGNYRVGGLIGDNFYGSISNCYSTGAVTKVEDGGSGGIAGLVGGNNQGNISNCFWDVETSGIGISGDDNYGATGKTMLEMQSRSTFIDATWDFVGEDINGSEGVWRMCVDGVEYPKLWWEFGVGDFACGDGVDLVDFAVLAETWNLSAEQDGYNYKCDLASDDTIDFVDLVIFIDHWLEGVEE